MPDQKDPHRTPDDSIDQSLTPLIKAYIDEKLKDAEKSDHQPTSKSWKRSWRSASPITKGTLGLTAAAAFATIAYAIIAAFQLGEMRHTNTLTQQALSASDKTYEILNRPYVGIFEVNVAYTMPSDPTHQKTQPMRTSDSDGLLFDFAVKNFGNVPANDYVLGWDIRIDGVPIPGHSVGSPSFLFPSDVNHLRAGILGDNYKRVVTDGTSTLEVEVRSDYARGDQHYQYCVRSRFFRARDNFITLGASCSQPWGRGPD